MPAKAAPAAANPINAPAIALPAKPEAVASPSNCCIASSSPGISPVMLDLNILALVGNSSPNLPASLFSFSALSVASTNDFSMAAKFGSASLRAFLTASPNFAASIFASLASFCRFLNRFSTSPLSPIFAKARVTAFS